MSRVFSFLIFFLTLNIFAEGYGEDFWKKNEKDQPYFVQPSFDFRYAERNAFNDVSTVRAKINVDWGIYTLVSLPKSFLDWNIGVRKDSIEKMMKGNPPSGFSAHDPSIATYGYKRLDSDFELDNAIKGIGYLPKLDRIDDLITLLKDNKTKDVSTRLKTLLQIYNQYEYYFDTSKIISLELYATPERGTQTFLNQYTTPLSVIVFASEKPTFKIKAIAQLISPHDPNLLDYQKKVLEYTNLVHDFFHDSDKDVPPKIVVIYYVLEVYNTTPDSSDGEGKRIDKNVYGLILKDKKEKTISSRPLELSSIPFFLL